MATPKDLPSSAAGAQCRNQVEKERTASETGIVSDRDMFAVVTAEGGGWSAFVPGVPVSGEGDDLDGAMDDLIEALREYADDWNDRLLHAPNHRGNWALAALTGRSDDEQLRGWLLDPASGLGDSGYRVPNDG